MTTMFHCDRKGTRVRIASLLSSATAMLYGLGLGDQVVAVSHECDYPAGVVGKPRATFSHIQSESSSQAIDEQVKALLAEGKPLYEIDTVKLIELKPDLVVTQAQCDVCAVRYEDVVDFVRGEPSLVDTQIVSLNPLNVADVLRDIERIGLATGRESRAAEWVSELESRIATVRTTAAALPPERRPRVACIEWIEPLMCAGNWMPELIDWAGGVQTFSKPGVHSSYTPWDDLIEFDPQVIVVMPCGFDLARTIHESQRLAELPRWHDLTAVQLGEVYAVDGNAYFNRSGPRLVESLELLASLINPGAFKRPEDQHAWKRLSARR